MIPVFDLKDQYNAMRDEINEAVTRVLESGWFILGEQGAAFEQEFAADCGVQHAVGVGNGTDALRLALQACAIGRGDEVSTAPNSAAFTALAKTSSPGPPKSRAPV